MLLGHSEPLTRLRTLCLESDLPALTLQLSPYYSVVLVFLPWDKPLQDSCKQMPGFKILLLKLCLEKLFHLSGLQFLHLCLAESLQAAPCVCSFGGLLSLRGLLLLLPSFFPPFSTITNVHQKYVYPDNSQNRSVIKIKLYDGYGLRS